MEAIGGSVRFVLNVVLLPFASWTCQNFPTPALAGQVHV